MGLRSGTGVEINVYMSQIRIICGMILSECGRMAESFSGMAASHKQVETLPSEGLHERYRRSSIIAVLVWITPGKQWYRQDRDCDSSSVVL